MDVQEQILGLDVPMTDALRVDIGERAEELVYVELDFEDRHNGLHLVEVARCTVHSLRDELEHKIEVHLVLLWLKPLATRSAQIYRALDTYPLTIVVEESLELHDVGMPDNAHDLEFSILQEVSTVAVASRA